MKLSLLLSALYAISVPHLSEPVSTSDAVIATDTVPAFGAGYENNFFLPQIGRSSIKMVYPTRSVNSSASFSFYGFSEYWNIEAGVGFSHLFKPYIAIGLEAFFSGFHFSGEGGFKASGGANISILTLPTKNLSIGFYARNITFSPLIPVCFNLGVSYNFSSKVIISMEGMIEIKQPFMIMMGVEYMPVRQFIMRLGVSYRTSAAAGVGFGLRFGGFFMDFDAEYKLVSGMCCKAGIGVKINRKKR